MAKEPKLFADIRASKERAAKAEKHAPPQPTGPILSATVQDNPVAPTPTNYIVKTLDECTTAEHCETLLAHAKQHGYAEEGQTICLIRAKIAGLKGGTHHSELTAERLHAAKLARLQPAESKPATKRVAKKATKKRGGRR